MGTPGNASQLASTLVRTLVALAIATALAISALLVTLLMPAPGQGGLSGLAVMVGRGTDIATTIFWEIRFPVVVTLVVAGSALGAAAGLLRAATRLPVADPGAFGLSGLAALLMGLGALVLPAGVASGLGIALVVAATGALGLAPWRRIRGTTHRWVAVVCAGLGLAGATTLLRWMIGGAEARETLLAGGLGLVFGRAGSMGWGWLISHGVLVGLALAGTVLLCVVAPGPRRGPDLARFLVAGVLLGAAVALVGALAFLGLLAVWAARGLLGARAVRWAPVVAAPLGAALMVLLHPLPPPCGDLLLPLLAVPVILGMISQDLRATEAAQQNSTSYAPPATPTPRSLYPPPR